MCSYQSSFIRIFSRTGCVMAPRERFELPRSRTSGFRDHRHTGLGYLGSAANNSLYILKDCSGIKPFKIGRQSW